MPPGRLVAAEARPVARRVRPFHGAFCYRDPPRTYYRRRAASALTDESRNDASVQDAGDTQLQ